MLRKLLKNLIYTLSSILIVTFILNLLYYFNLFNDSVMNILLIISVLICFLISGRNFSKIDKSRGFISGLKIGLIYSVLFLIITLIFWKDNFKLIDLIYYILLSISSMFGGMLSNYKIDEIKKIDI